MSDDIHSLIDGIERLENKPLDPSELEKLRSKKKEDGRVKGANLGATIRQLTAVIKIGMMRVASLNTISARSVKTSSFPSPDTRTDPEHHSVDHFESPSPRSPTSVAAKLNFHQIAVSLREYLKQERSRFASMTELYKDTESKLAFEDHIYVIDDILRERKLKGGESGFNPNPSANLSANHTISELCDNFNKQIRDGGRSDHRESDDDNDIIKDGVAQAFETYEFRSSDKKWRRKNGGEVVQFNEMVGENIYMMKLTLRDNEDYCVELAQAVGRYDRQDDWFETPCSCQR